MDHLTKPQVYRLLEVAKAHSHRNYCMLLMMYFHGLRVSEVVGEGGLTAKNIRDGRLVVQRLKGSLKTVHPLIQSKTELLDEKKHFDALYAEFEALDQMDVPVFNIQRMQVWRIMQKYCKIAGIPLDLAHPHILKHSICMHSIKDAGIHNLQKYVGHRNLNSTAAYLKVTDQEASAAVGAAIA